MKVLVIGNCQSRPLASLLLTCCAQVKRTDVIVVHLAKHDERDAHEALMQDADLIVSQWTSDQYPVEHVTSSHVRQRHPEKTLIWPNIFFAGQQPYLRTIVCQTGQRIIGPYDTYHDLRILSDWYRDRLGVSSAFEIDPEAVCRASLEELQTRERSCDVTVADIIAAHLDDRKLFFTFNHPSTWLLSRVAERICEEMGLDFDPTLIGMGEPLSGITVESTWSEPEGQVVLSGKSIDFDEEPFVRPGPPMAYTKAEVINLFYQSYDRQMNVLKDRAALRFTPNFD